MISESRALYGKELAISAGLLSVVIQGSVIHYSSVRVVLDQYKLFLLCLHILVRYVACNIASNFPNDS